MKLLNPKEFGEIRVSNPKLLSKAFTGATMVGSTIALIMVVIAPVVEENTMFFSLVFGAVSFVAVGNALLQEKCTESKE